MFTQKDSLDRLEVKTETGAEITLYFENSAVDVIDIDGHEFDAIDDVLKNMFVKVEGEFYTLRRVILDAELSYDGICEESRQEDAIESNMARELSSPSLTGRIWRVFR